MCILACGIGWNSCAGHWRLAVIDNIRPTVVRGRAGIARTLSSTDSCRDRLAAYYHWNDRQSLDVAVQIALRQRINMARVRTWSAAEGHAEQFDEFRSSVRSRKRPSGVALMVLGPGLLLLSGGAHLRNGVGLAGLRVEAAGGTLGGQSEERFVPSRPETVVWGWYPIDREPVLTISSGETVRVDTLTHAGATQNEDPETYLGAYGVERGDILPDVFDFWASRDGRPREGRSGHVITGPIFVDGAEPGDMLEVQILDLSTRVPYGINNTSPTGGVFSRGYPGVQPDDPLLDIPPRTRHFIRTATVGGRDVALFSPQIQVPLAPFMGIMAVAPANPTVGQPGVTVPGIQSSRPPGPFGGNMDVKDLAAGSVLYLPVFQPGALFYVGDSHSAQGDGEVSGTAIEQSLTGVFRFVLHKGRTISGPRAETDTHYIAMGIDLDLDRALRMAVWEVVNFLVEAKGLTPAKALSLASIAVDFHVGEAVDLTQVVTGRIPKSLFLSD